MGIALALAASLAATGCDPARQTAIIVHVDQESIRREEISIEFPTRNTVQFQPYRGTDSRYQTNAFYRRYIGCVTWPAANRNRRNDFVLYGRLQNSLFTSFFLQFGRRDPTVELYLFYDERRRCERLLLPQPEAEADIFRQIATAEAMFRIERRGQRCVGRSLRHWTEIWIDRVTRLRNRNIFVRISPTTMERVRAAYARPFNRFIVFPARLRPPAQLNEIWQRDQAISRQFDESN